MVSRASTAEKKVSLTFKILNTSPLNVLLCLLSYLNCLLLHTYMYKPHTCMYILITRKTVIHLLSSHLSKRAVHRRQIY